jgi:hypothetical protein
MISGLDLFAGTLVCLFGNLLMVNLCMMLVERKQNNVNQPVSLSAFSGLANDLLAVCVLSLGSLVGVPAYLVGWIVLH